MKKKIYFEQDDFFILIISGRVRWDRKEEKGRYTFIRIVKVWKRFISTPDDYKHVSQHGVEVLCEVKVRDKELKHKDSESYSLYYTILEIFARMQHDNLPIKYYSIQ